MKSSGLQPEQLHTYQQKAIDFLFGNDEGLLIVRMGGGKTVIFATALSELLQGGHIERALVVAPKRVAQIVWPDEFATWAHLDTDDLAIALGTVKQRTAAFQSPARIVVTNYENLTWAADAGMLERFDAIVWDEISKMKDHGSKRWRRFARELRQFYIR